jgi:hypothetical protein
MRARTLLAGTLVVAVTAGSAAAARAAPHSPPICDSKEHHQLDFWVGKWDVYTASGNKLVAHSIVEKLYGGCAVRENWMPLGNNSGGSLSTFEPADSAWRQYWVDSMNNVNEYVGRLEGRGISWSGRSVDRGGATHMLAMQIRPEAAGAVRQTCKTSPDSGKTWQVDCDLIYRPEAQPNATALNK